jgi:hypothetical protein
MFRLFLLQDAVLLPFPLCCAEFYLCQNTPEWRLICTVLFATQGYSSDEWELAILTLKRTGYHIKVKDEVLTEEKYSSNLQVCSLVYLLIFFVLIYKCSSILAILIHVICFCLILLCFMFWQTKIPNGRTTQFVLVSSGGVNIPFNTQGISEPNNEDSDVRLRDLIVLVLRTFQSKVESNAGIRC